MTAENAPPALSVARDDDLVTFAEVGNEPTAWITIDYEDLIDLGWER